MSDLPPVEIHCFCASSSRNSCFIKRLWHHLPPLNSVSMGSATFVPCFACSSIDHLRLSFLLFLLHVSSATKLLDQFGHLPDHRRLCFLPPETGVCSEASGLTTQVPHLMSLFKYSTRSGGTSSRRPGDVRCFHSAVAAAMPTISGIRQPAWRRAAELKSRTSAHCRSSIYPRETQCCFSFSCTRAANARESPLDDAITMMQT